MEDWENNNLQHARVCETEIKMVYSINITLRSPSGYLMMVIYLGFSPNFSYQGDFKGETYSTL